MNRNIAAAALVAVIAATGATRLVGPAEARVSVVCKQMTWGFSKRPVRAMAKQLARQNWRANAGPAWNTWALAKDRSEYCRKDGNLWNCGAKGRPCRKPGVTN